MFNSILLFIDSQSCTELYYNYNIFIVVIHNTYREWRISHVVSHHVYTNTVHDLEMTLLHPFIHWFPTDDKPPLVRYVPYLTLIAYPLIAPGQFVIRYVYIIIISEKMFVHVTR